MIRTQIQLSEEQMKSLKRLAAERQVSVAELVRQGVDVVLGAAAGERMEEKRRRAISVAGRFHSGVRDLSTRHDDYVAEAYSE